MTPDLLKNNFKKSVDRAIALMGTPSDYAAYIAIKIKPSQGGCCCFHCWPKTWAAINKHIADFGPIEDEGDALIGRNDDKFTLECHESGPEIILYTAISGLIVESIVGLVSIFLKNLQNEDHKRPSSLKIVKRRQIKGKIKEVEIMEIDFPLSDDVIKKLNDNIIKIIEKSKK